MCYFQANAIHTDIGITVKQTNADTPRIQSSHRLQPQQAVYPYFSTESIAASHYRHHKKQRQKHDLHIKHNHSIHRSYGLLLLFDDLC